jgi:transposase
VLTAGQAHETIALEDVLQRADQELRDDDGAPIAWPVSLAGDKGYRADWIDAHLLELGIKPVIPSKANEDASARVVAFDKAAYKERNIIERLIGWLKECRRVFSRFEKSAINYSGMIKMAFIQRYLKLACD